MALRALVWAKGLKQLYSFRSKCIFTTACLWYPLLPLSFPGKSCPFPSLLQNTWPYFILVSQPGLFWQGLPNYSHGILGLHSCLKSREALSHEDQAYEVFISQHKSSDDACTRHIFRPVWKWIWIFQAFFFFLKYPNIQRYHNSQLQLCILDAWN